MRPKRGTFQKEARGRREQSWFSMMILKLGVLIVLVFSSTVHAARDVDSAPGLSRIANNRASSVSSSVSSTLLSQGDSLENEATNQRLEWAGQFATHEELGIVRFLREKVAIRMVTEPSTPSLWLSTATDVELLRFVRAKHGNKDEAWKMVLSHALWRTSQYGADSNFTREFFADSPLHHEVFWMGHNKEGCPTLVIRTQIHDGIYYNEDPHVFARYNN
jgi:hypothetical protein